MSEQNPFTTFGVVSPQTATSMPGLAFLRQMLDRQLPAPPISAAADIWLAEAERGRIVFEARPSARFYNPMGTLHGGWLSIVLDSVMGCAVHSCLDAGFAYTTLEMKVNFVRPVFEETGPLRCEGWIVHQGKRTATAEGRLFDASGALLAHGSETCLITDLSAAADRRTPKPASND